MRRMLIFITATGFAINGSAQSPMPAATPTSLTTLSGKIYKNVRVFRVEPDGINYAFDGGLVKIPFSDLPETIRKQYGYSPAKAAEYQQQDSMVQAEADQIAREEIETIARRQKKAAIISQISSTAMQFNGTLFKVDSRGALLRDVRFKTEGVWSDRLDQTIYVVGLPGHLVDGDSWEGILYYYGNILYVSPYGEKVRMRGFGTTIESAYGQFGHRTNE